MKHSDSHSWKKQKENKHMLSRSKDAIKHQPHKCPAYEKACE